MSAYLIIQAIIKDDDAYGAYRRAVVPIIAKFGGEIVRNEKARIFEGPSAESPPTLIRFPSTTALNDFWNSSDYGEAKAIREGAADLVVWAIS